MTQRFAQYDIAHSKIAHESEIIENGNWKLVIENNRECYHCAATHQELTASFLPEDFGFCTDGLGEDSLQALAEYHRRNADRSEERRVGKEGVSTCRSRGSPDQ